MQAATYPVFKSRHDAQLLAVAGPKHTEGTDQQDRSRAIHLVCITLLHARRRMVR